MNIHVDIDGITQLINPSTKKKKRPAVNPTWSCSRLDKELELKLPNEFKGKIHNYNCHNMNNDYLIDENDYRY